MKAIIRTKSNYRNLNGSMLDVVEQTSRSVAVMIPAENVEEGWGDTISDFSTDDVQLVYEPGEMKRLSYPQLIMN